jgi:hypothetical protein
MDVNPPASVAGRDACRPPLVELVETWLIETAWRKARGIVNTFVIAA